MSYFYLQSKSHLLSHQKENILIGSNNPINPFYLYWKEIMLIKLNKNTIYVNFNKHKLNYVICDIKNLPINREYIVIPIIPMVGFLKLNRNQFVYNTTT